MVSKFRSSTFNTYTGMPDNFFGYEMCQVATLPRNNSSSSSNRNCPFIPLFEWALLHKIQSTEILFFLSSNVTSAEKQRIQICQQAKSILNTLFFNKILSLFSRVGKTNFPASMILSLPPSLPLCWLCLHLGAQIFAEIISFWILFLDHTQRVGFFRSSPPPPPLFWGGEGWGRGGFTDQITPGRSC